MRRLLLLGMVGVVGVVGREPFESRELEELERLKVTTPPPPTPPHLNRPAVFALSVSRTRKIGVRRGRCTMFICEARSKV